MSYWTDGRGDERIIYVTTGYRLVELNAKTGAVIPSFGNDGILDLKVGAVKGNNQQIDLETGEIGIHVAPTVTGDVVIIGSSMREGATVPTHNNTKGLVRAFDVKSGKQLWRFDTIPRPGEFGSETWENGSGRRTATPACGRTSPSMRIPRPRLRPRRDAVVGLLRRPPARCQSVRGKPRRARPQDRPAQADFQFVHHPIWNWDMTSAPILSDISVNGRPVKAVSVASKQGWL